MKNIITIFIFLILLQAQAQAQVGFGTAQPTAMLEIKTEATGTPALRLKPQIAPVGTDAGQLAVIGDKLFMFDANRSKWLSVEQTALEFGRLGSGSDPKEIEFGGGDIQTGVNMPFDGTIVCLSIGATKDDSSNINVFINDVAIPNNDASPEVDGVLNLNQTSLKFLDEGYNLNFSAGDTIKFEVDSGVTDEIANLIVVAYVKWRKDNS